MTIAVVAEKPSVARDIAAALGAGQRGDGCLRGGGYVVTWAIGHLVGLAEPAEIRPEWKRWARETLPMLPDEWPLHVIDATRAQFEVVRKVLNARDTAISNVSLLAANEERYKESQIKYMAGKINFIDLTNVESSLVDARQNQLQYLRNANNKKLALENLLGVGLEN